MEKRERGQCIRSRMNARCVMGSQPMRKKSAYIRRIIYDENGDFFHCTLAFGAGCAKMNCRECSLA